MIISILLDYGKGGGAAVNTTLNLLIIFFPAIHYRRGSIYVMYSSSGVAYHNSTALHEIVNII